MSNRSLEPIYLRLLPVEDDRKEFACSFIPAADEDEVASSERFEKQVTLLLVGREVYSGSYSGITFKYILEGEGFSIPIMKSPERVHSELFKVWNGAPMELYFPTAKQWNGGWLLEMHYEFPNPSQPVARMRSQLLGIKSEKLDESKTIEPALAMPKARESEGVTGLLALTDGIGGGKPKVKKQVTVAHGTVNKGSRNMTKSIEKKYTAQGKPYVRQYCAQKPSGEYYIGNDSWQNKVGKPMAIMAFYNYLKEQDIDAFKGKPLSLFSAAQEWVRQHITSANRNFPSLKNSSLEEAVEAAKAWVGEYGECYEANTIPNEVEQLIEEYNKLDILAKKKRTTPKKENVKPSAPGSQSLHPMKLALLASQKVGNVSGNDGASPGMKEARKVRGGKKRAAQEDKQSNGATVGVKRTQRERTATNKAKVSPPPASETEVESEEDPGVDSDY